MCSYIESSLSSFNASILEFVVCKCCLSVCSLYFHSLSNVFHRAKVLNFDESFYQFFFTFVDRAFGVISNIYLPDPRSWRYFVFFFKSFIVLCFPFISVIYSESSFFVQIWDLGCDSFFYFAYAIFWKENPFSTKLLFTLFSKVKWPYLCGSISGLITLFHSSMGLNLCPYHSFN